MSTLSRLVDDRVIQPAPTAFPVIAAQSRDLAPRVAGCSAQREPVRM